DAALPLGTWRIAEGRNALCTVRHGIDAGERTLDCLPQTMNTTACPTTITFLCCAHAPKLAQWLKLHVM
ncbi:unnamed protein product, partial [Ixodes persulcatus]